MRIDGVLIAAKERKERKRKAPLFFAFSEFFCGHLTVG